MLKFLMRTLSSACVIVFVFYLHKLDIFLDKRFTVLLILFLAFGLVSLIQGMVLGVDNNA